MSTTPTPLRKPTTWTIYITATGDPYPKKLWAQKGIQFPDEIQFVNYLSVAVTITKVPDCVDPEIVVVPPNGGLAARVFKLKNGATAREYEYEYEYYTALGEVESQETRNGTIDVS